MRVTPTISDRSCCTRLCQSIALKESDAEGCLHEPLRFFTEHSTTTEHCLHSSTENDIVQTREDQSTSIVANEIDGMGREGNVQLLVQIGTVEALFQAFHFDVVAQMKEMTSKEVRLTDLLVHRLVNSIQNGL